MCLSLSRIVKTERPLDRMKMLTVLSSLYNFTGIFNFSNICFNFRNTNRSCCPAVSGHGNCRNRSGWRKRRSGDS